MGSVETRCAVLIGGFVLGACAQPRPQNPPAEQQTAPRQSTSPASLTSPPSDPQEAATTRPAQLDPDGNDDTEDVGAGSLPAVAHFERVGRAPLALRRICDLTVFHDSLYAAHANDPLGTDGATLTRYRPIDDTDGPNGGPKSPFSIAFDWNRPGEPTGGGGAGQGFLRVHAIDGRLFVPDADPPYNGFGISEGGTEGFVFVSDGQGKFARAMGEHFRPPAAPTADGGAGAAVLPRAYHVLDVIRFRGRFYASTGSVPPTERAWRGASPGALHVANASLSRWTYEVDYPYPWQDGVWRLGFMVRYKDRLYAGIQDYDGREPNDYVTFAPPPDATVIGHNDVHGVRVTPTGAAFTLRWFADQGRLYWIVLQRDGVGALRVTEDGDNWNTVALPAEGGRPTDIARFRDGLVVLTERALYRIDGGAHGMVPIGVIAPVLGKHPPFEQTDAFCASPLAVYRNELYAGGQRDGSLYRLAPGPAPPPSEKPAKH
jgi:hypothetical protein